MHVLSVSGCVRTLKILLFESIKKRLLARALQVREANGKRPEAIAITVDRIGASEGRASSVVLLMTHPHREPVADLLFPLQSRCLCKSPKP